MLAVRTPEASRPTCHAAVSGCSLPRRAIGSAASITFDIGAITPFACAPAYTLSVYASQWLLPDTTQDSIRGCPAQALPRSPSQATELNALARRNDRVTGSGRPPPVPTERGVRFSRTTLFDRWFTALRGPAAFRKEVAVLDAVTDISP